MGKSDETHRCDVQKIAEEKYITQKALGTLSKLFKPF